MNLQEWQAAARQNLTRLAGSLRRLAPDTLYGFLAAATLLPVVTAANQGDFAALATLGSVIGGERGNLVANQIQAWKDRSQAELAAELQHSAQADLQWRQALDTLLAKLEASSAVQASLSAADKAWFARTLEAELAALDRLQATQVNSSGAIVQGEHNIGAGAGGVAARDIHGNVTVINQTGGAAAGADPASLRLAYLNHLYEQANTLSLAGIDPKAASDAEARLSLGAVYTALLTQSQADDLRPDKVRLPDARPQPVSALAQLNRYDRLVLLGDPGSGKSTFVNFVALCLAGEALGKAPANLKLLTAPLPVNPEAARRAGGEEQKAAPQPWQHGALLPVRVVLRDFAARGLPEPGQTATANHLWEFIVAELKDCALPDFAPILRQEWLHQGGLLLLDGLDEVPEANQRRTAIKTAVEDFGRAFARCRILVTSRTYAYQQQDWQLDRFESTVLAPFSPGQVAQFVERWYAHIGELRHWNVSDTQGRAEVLKRAIAGSDRLAGLAERPLLLTLMASLHAWRGGSLPERREELYADAVDLLLDWWESQRVVRNAQGQVVVIQPSLVEWLRIDRQKMRGFLNELAYRAHAGQATLVGTADIAEKDLVAGLLSLTDRAEVKPRLLLAHLSQRTGLLVPRGVGVYTFPHRTFQEYLAACYLTDHDYPDLVAGLARADPGRWREVALLAGAKAARGAAVAIWSLVDALCYRAPAEAAYAVEDAWGAHLAGQALVETANLTQVAARNQPKRARVQEGLLHVLAGSTLPALERASAGRTLARLGDPRPAVMTIEGMQFCFVPAGPFTMGSGEKEPGADSDEKPQHTVDLAYDYWMGRYPVTNAQYQAFVDDGGYRVARYWPEAAQVEFWRPGEFKGRLDKDWRRGPARYGEPFELANHPVVGVSWYEALAFTRWLGERWAVGRLPAGCKVRLPSEAEWEKAARGGHAIPAAAVTWAPASGAPPPGRGRMQSNPDARRRYPWSGEFDAERTNGAETDIGATSALGCFIAGASPYGVEEMSGNVWEWTRSQWQDYPYPVNADARARRENLAAGWDTGRVLRGNAYYANRTVVRCAFRVRDDPFDLGGDLGFRVVLSP